jgi:hypothetical protein
MTTLAATKPHPYKPLDLLDIGWSLHRRAVLELLVDAFPAPVATTSLVAALEKVLGQSRRPVRRINRVMSNLRSPLIHCGWTLVGTQSNGGGYHLIPLAEFRGEAAG